MTGRYLIASGRGRSDHVTRYTRGPARTVTTRKRAYNDREAIVAARVAEESRVRVNALMANR